MLSIRLADLAQQLDAKLHGDGSIVITGIASIYNAKNGQITFLSNKNLLSKLSSCEASAIVLASEDLSFWPGNALIVSNPYLAYAKIAQIMDTTPQQVKKIDTSAIIASDAILGQNISIGTNVVIESGAILGDNVVIGPGSIIGKNTKIGNNTRLLANVTIYHNIEIGQFCLIQSGVVIGSDGFGYAKDRQNWIKIPQLGRVIIGNKVEIGSCTTIDRGSLDDTYIGNGVVIDNQCHVAHNVIIGDNTAIAGGVILAGSLTIGSNCQIGGASVINGHIEICDMVTITGMSMIIRPITKPGIYSSGIPIQSNKEWKKTITLVMNIVDINNRIKSIERKLEKT